MDWRDAQERLEAADPDDGLAPLVDGLEPGDRLLLVIPSGGPRRTDTEWVTTFRRLGSEWRRTLLRDERLARPRRLPPRGQDRHPVQRPAVRTAVARSYCLASVQLTR